MQIGLLKLNHHVDGNGVWWHECLLFKASFCEKSGGLACVAGELKCFLNGGNDLRTIVYILNPNVEVPELY